MFKKMIGILFILLWGGTLIGCTAAKAAALPSEQPGTTTANQIAPLTLGRTVTVVGEGQMSQEPDLALIYVGAEMRAESVIEAKATVETIMGQIITALEEMNIAGNDIQTSHYNIHYEREQVPSLVNQPAAEGNAGYYVSNMLEVTIRDVETAGEVLDAVVQAGANQVHGVTFAVADETVWQSESRALAMADARSRAAALADLAGVELGPVLTISEIIGDYPLPFMRSEGGGGGLVPGVLDFTTQVQVTFAIDG